MRNVRWMPQDLSRIHDPRDASSHSSFTPFFLEFSLLQLFDSLLQQDKQKNTYQVKTGIATIMRWSDDGICRESIDDGSGRFIMSQLVVMRHEGDRESRFSGSIRSMSSRRFYSQPVDTMKFVIILSATLLTASCSSFVLRSPASGIARRPFMTSVFAAKKKADTSAAKDNDDSNSNNKNNEMNPAKKAALDGVLHQIERAYGRGSVVRLGSASQYTVECTPSGALTLDAALGGRGYPKGRVVEIYGPESSGKTTLALHAIAEAQRRGGTAAFVDAEHALDPAYAKALGVNIDDLLVSQPDSGEMALDVIDQLVRSAAVDVIVCDSVAALVPRAELEGDMSDAQIGLQARLMSKALRKITGSLALSQSTVIFINQLRSKVGVIYGR
jgi:RecA/RadA recombinase